VRQRHARQLLAVAALAPGVLLLAAFEPSDLTRA